MTHLRDVPCGPTLRSDSTRGESHYPSPGGSPWRPETPRALVCASTVSRAVQPYRLCSAAFPAATRRAPGGETRGPSRPTSPLTRAGRFPLPSALGTRDSNDVSALEGWATSTFSRAERTYRHCSAAPHFAPGACLGSRAGCPASTTPLTRAGQPPGLRATSLRRHVWAVRRERVRWAARADILSALDATARPYADRPTGRRGEQGR